MLPFNCDKFKTLYILLCGGYNMVCVESIVEVKVIGIRIDEDFTIDEKIYDDTVNCSKATESYG
ncbi:hypothetical protein PP176A_0911 [Sporanaerobacter sp. PP17-6a]|nr:hypothetical protein PP176A_0911 [Sporanaerobacter sp. PP17-6a]